MADTFVGGFTKASGASGSQSVTGVGFLPTIGMFAYTAQAATGWRADGVWCEGWFLHDVGVDVGEPFASCRAWYIEDGSATNVDSQRTGGDATTDKILRLHDEAGTLLASCVMDSLDADGFSVTWSSSETAQNLVRFFGIRAGLIDEFYSQIDNTAPTSTGTQTFNSAGFQPDIVIFRSSGNQTNTGDFTITSSVNGFGVAQGTTNQWATYTFQTDAASASSANTRRSGMITDGCIVAFTTDGSNTGKAAISAVDSSGFTLNWTAVTGTAFKFDYYAIKFRTGISFNVGSFTKPTGAAPASTSIEPGFEPSLVILHSACGTTTGTAEAHGNISRSAFTSSASWTTCVQDVGSADPSECNTYLNDSLVAAVPHASSGQTLAAVAEATIDADGFDLNFTTNDSNATVFGYIAIGGQDPEEVAFTVNAVADAVWLSVVPVSYSAVDVTASVAHVPITISPPKPVTNAGAGVSLSMIVVEHMNLTVSVGADAELTPEPVSATVMNLSVGAVASAGAPGRGSGGIDVLVDGRADVLSQRRYRR